MLHALAGLTLLLTAADHWTTYLCLRGPVQGWRVSELNPLADWLFVKFGLVPGLLIDSTITLAAVAFLATTALSIPATQETRKLVGGCGQHVAHLPRQGLKVRIGTERRNRANFEREGSANGVVGGECRRRGAGSEASRRAVSRGVWGGVRDGA
jgi:hypothetical protein